VDTDSPIEKAEGFLSSLYSLYRIRALYPTTHPRYTEALIPVVEAKEQLFKNRDTAVFFIVEHEFIFEDQPLFRTMTMMRDFVAIFEEFHIDRFIFQRENDEEEISSFIGFLSTKPELIKEEEGFEAAIRKHHLQNIILERLSRSKDISEVVSDYTAEDETYGVLPPSIRTPYSNIYKHAKAAFSELAGGREGDLHHLSRQIEKSITDLCESVGDFIDTFHQNRTTFGDLDHEINVCLLTVALARMMELDQTVIKDLALAALLHDVGKLSLPPEIQRKPPNQLSPEEMPLYKEHPLRGAEHLLIAGNIPQLAVIACYEHHVGYDRSGFPTLPEDRTPHFAALIIGLVEQYEKLVRLSPKERKAIEYITEMRPLRGGLFEPRLFDLFASLMVA